MAKESFENKMLNSIYETDKPRMQFLLDNKALTLDVVKYIERHMRFVSTRCIDNEKHWQVLYNFSDFLELKKIHEQIKEKQQEGSETEVEQLQQRFNEIKKKFDVSDSENVLTAKKYAQEWDEFLKYCYLLSEIDSKVEKTEPTNNLGNVMAEWVKLKNPTPQQLTKLIKQTHLTYLSDNGLKGYNVELVDGEGVRCVMSEQKMYVGLSLVSGQKSQADLFNVLNQVLSSSETVCVSTTLNKQLKTIPPTKQAMAYERAISIINAIRTDSKVTNTEPLKALLMLNSAELIKTYCGEQGEQYYKQIALGLQPITLTDSKPTRIVEEYYEPHKQKMQTSVNKWVASSKQQAKQIK